MNKILGFLMLIPFLFPPVLAEETTNSTHTSNSAIMQQFIPEDSEKAQRISDKNRHKILFYMGVALLTLIITTAILGIMMVLYKKPYFVAHMIFAGLTVTLSIAHAVVAVVWFFPF